MQKIFRLVITAVTGTGLLLAQAPRTDEVQLKAAVHKQEVEGDLKGAIEQYKKLAQGKDRGVAAKALVRMGQCYDKLGDTEARKAYERVVKEFADQKEAVEQARGRLSASRVIAPGGLTVRKVLGWPEADYGIRISPDGRYFSFVDEKNGEEIALRDLATGVVRVLTRHLPGEKAGADDPLWSRDGRQLVYDWANYKEIRLINPDGSGMRTVLKLGSDEWVSPYDWSPDGKRVLVVRNSAKDKDKYEIQWLNLDDGSTKTIASIPNPAGLYVSPDGRHIAYGTKTKGGFHLMASDGGGDTIITSHPSGEWPVGWSPDGKQVLFMSMRGNGPGLWVIPVTNGKASGAARSLQPYLGDGASEKGMTRSGAFYYKINAMSSDVYTAAMDAASGRVTSSPMLVPLSSSGDNLAPRWSPDGRKLLITSSQFIVGGKPKDYSIYSFDENKQQAIAADRQARGAAWCWAPDGRSILANGPDKPFVTRVNRETGAVSAAFDGPLFAAISCSANGKLLAFQLPRGKSVNVRDMESGSEREVYKSGEDSWVYIPEISPDGQQVAFFQREKDGISLRLVSASGGADRELARLKWPVEFQLVKGLAWSADSRHVYFLRRSDAKSPHELFRVAASGGQEESMGLKAADIRDLNISPDGTRIAFSIGSLTKQEIWAMENFLPVSK